MVMMQQLPFKIRCTNCNWSMSESSDAIMLPSECPKCGETRLKYEDNPDKKLSPLEAWKKSSVLSSDQLLVPVKLH